MATLRRNRFGAAAKALLACALLGAAPIPASDPAIARLKADDLILATAATRLVVANAARCTDQMPATGLVIAAIDQYPPALRAKARAELGCVDPIGVEAGVPDFAADRAGLRVGDGLLAIGDQVIVFMPLSTAASSANRDQVERQLIALPPRSPITMQVNRAGRSVTATLQPVSACRARFEVVASDQLIARSDGTTIQLSNAFVERFGEGGVAVAFAHELAHLVLRHPLKASKQAERDADRLSVHLLATAGYDPQIAPRFWRAHGASMGSRGHDSVKRRISLLEAEIVLKQR